MVTFKGRCDKLYYTQHILLNNGGQLLFFFRNKHTHTQRKGKGKGKMVLIQMHTTTLLESHGNF